ncbi:hypothetical protein MAJ_11249, partial [Metarhizium majus ARSEF 297]
MPQRAKEARRSRAKSSQAISSCGGSSRGASRARTCGTTSRSGSSSRAAAAAPLSTTPGPNSDLNASAQLKAETLQHFSPAPAPSTPAGAPGPQSRSSGRRASAIRNYLTGLLASALRGKAARRLFKTPKAEAELKKKNSSKKKSCTTRTKSALPPS